MAFLTQEGIIALRDLTVKVVSYSDRPLVKVYKDDRHVADIKLEDNGIHIELSNNKRLIVIPNPDIDFQVEEIVSNILERLGDDEVAYMFGDDRDMEEVEYLILGDPWYNKERLALTASKHVAVFSKSREKKGKIVVGVTRFLPDLMAVTVMRGEDTFPLGQILVDYSTDPPTVKVLNELGEEIATESSSVEKLGEILSRYFQTDLNDSLLVYRDQPDNAKSPMVIESEKGVFYVGAVVRFLLFVSSKSGAVRLKGLNHLKSLLKALLYLKEEKNEGVWIYTYPYAIDLENLGKTLDRIYRKINVKIKDIGATKKYMNGYVLVTNSLKDLKLSELTVRNGLYVKAIPVAFLVVTRSWEKYSEYVDRILQGPVKEGRAIMEKALQETLGDGVVPELLSLEEMLYLLQRLNKDLAVEKG